MAAGRGSRRSISAGSRPVRARAWVQAIGQARLTAFRETLHPLAPRLAADPCGAQSRRVLAAPTSHSSMSFLRSSASPVSFQGSWIVLSMISSDHTRPAARQPTPRPVMHFAQRWAINPIRLGYIDT